MLFLSKGTWTLFFPFLSKKQNKPRLDLQARGFLRKNEFSYLWQSCKILGLTLKQGYLSLSMFPEEEEGIRGLHDLLTFPFFSSLTTTVFAGWRKYTTKSNHVCSVYEILSFV